MNIIYATCGDKVYKRKVEATGVEAMNALMKPESKYQ
jgi:hypothetical protein